MKSFLPFLYNWNENLDSFSVNLSTRRKRYHKKKIVVFLTLTVYGIKEDRKYVACRLDSGIDNFWGVAFDNILKKLEPLLADKKSYKWKEIKNVILDYYYGKQKASIKDQKRRNIKTIYTPAGDYTLWQICEFLSYSLDLKYKFLKNDSLFADLKKKNLEQFDKNISQLILLPIFEKKLISKAVNNKKSDEIKVKKIINVIVDSKLNTTSLYENITSPEYDDPSKPLSSMEEREINALWLLFETDKKKTEKIINLSDVEKRLERLAFWESPQGKRLSKLNSRRVHGGTLTFEEKETKKRKKAIKISESLYKLILSWEMKPEAIAKGINHYQFRFENATMERWKKHKKLQQLLNKGKLQFEYLKEIVEGKWDSDSVNLFGVMVGVSLAVGLGVYSAVCKYKLFFGTISSVASILLYILISKLMWTRRLIIKLMRWILK